MFVAELPYEASGSVHFRKRIGEAGIKLILQASIRTNGNDCKNKQVSVNTTVQDKHHLFLPMPNCIGKSSKNAKNIGCFALASTPQLGYRVLNKLSVDRRFGHHPKNKSKARKANKKVKTIAGRLVQELERNPACHPYQTDIDLLKRVFNQKKTDSRKVYPLLYVLCISKGKEHKKYEFGNKVSIAYRQGVIAGTKIFRNKYGGTPARSTATG